VASQAGLSWLAASALVLGVGACRPAPAVAVRRVPLPPSSVPDGETKGPGHVPGPPSINVLETDQGVGAGAGAFQLLLLATTSGKSPSGLTVADFTLFWVVIRATYLSPLYQISTGYL